jgi:hypothetical protein
MPVQPFKLDGLSNPEAAPRILSEEEKHDIAEMRRLEDEHRASEHIAKFKIEVMFTSVFSVTKPVPGVISFWESGSKLHGGGDTIIHFCPGKRLGKNDCDHYIPDPAHGYGFLVCPKCHNVWKGDRVHGQILYRLHVQQWAEVIEQHYRKLDMNCDIVIKYHRADIRGAMRARFVQDSLEVVRSNPKRLKRIYTLKALMQDMSAGASLYDRIYAFVRA